LLKLHNNYYEVSVILAGDVLQSKAFYVLRIIKYGLGKMQGADLANDKVTYPSLLGLNGAKQMAT